MVRPLDGVEAKIARARIHLEALHRAAGRLFVDQPIRFDLVRDQKEGWFLVRPDFVAEPPLSLGVAIGDVVNNLRSALDHLVWQLSLAQTAKPSRQTQFPIADNASAFREQCFRIAWLPPDQQANDRELPAVQPGRLRIARALASGADVGSASAIYEGGADVMVDPAGRIAWIKDYGAPENGGLMYVPVDELVSSIQGRLA